MSGIPKKDWFKQAVVYQIYPRSFKDSDGDGVGDLNGITEKLPYLADLGVDVVWLSPVYKSPNADNGYDISDYRDIMDEFGTMADFDRMLARAHELGLKIMMDLVVNHSSDEHIWFKESSKPEKNRYSDYYIWRDEAVNNWGASFSGSVWKYSESRKQFYFHAFHEKQPDLNWENPEVRREVYDIMTWWCDKGVDGFRMDVINMISKPDDFSDGPVSETGYSEVFSHITNGPRVHDYLKEMNREVLSKYDLITVGETANVTVRDAERYAGYDSGELNMVFQFEHVGLETGKIGKWAKQAPKLTDLKKILSLWQDELYGKAWNSLYWDNHDQPRVVSRFGDDGKYRTQSAKMLATCLHFMQGTPYIYQGEELGMTNAGFTDVSQYRDVESVNAYHDLVGRKVLSSEDMLERMRYTSRDNARTPMQWTAVANAGFSGGTPWISVNPNYKSINAASQTDDPDSIFSYYKKLISLRKKHDIMVDGKYELLLADSEEIYAYTRTLDKESVLVICNFTGKAQEYLIPEDFTGGECLISNYNRADFSNNLTLEPYEALVVRKVKE